MTRELYPHLTDQQYRDNAKFIKKLHITNDDLDEDTPDSEGMDMRYTNDEAYQDYKNEAVQTLNSR